MPKFSFDFSVPASSAGEAAKKMQALSEIASHFSLAELEKMVHIIENDPVKLTMFKAYIRK